MSEYNRRQRWLAGDPNSRYPLLNSIRRSGYYDTKLKEEKTLKGWREGSKQVFPDEYIPKMESNKNVGDADQAGIIDLAVLRPGGNGIDTEFNHEISIGGRLVQPSGGKLRILDGDLISQSFDSILESNKYIDGLVGLMLSDETGSICRYILPSQYYEMLGANTSVSGMPSELAAPSARPEVITQHPPSSSVFTNGVAKLKYVTKQAQKSIMFDKDVSAMLKKYNEYHGELGKKGGCCC